MNKYYHCRCALCDHINVPGEEPLVFPLPDMCIDCYVAVSSCFTAVEDEDLGMGGGDPPREPAPAPTSGHLDPIYEEIMVEKDTEEAPALP